jgi:hypothetical protein
MSKLLGSQMFTDALAPTRDRSQVLDASPNYSGNLLLVCFCASIP